jgi:predicted nucleotidyltransferase
MFRDSLAKIATELNRLQIPYMVIGGQAVLLYGEPRLTKDIDITLGLGTDGFDEVKGMVHNLNLRILVDHPKAFVQKTMVLPVIDDKTGIRVDFIFSFSFYEKQAIARAKDVKLSRSMVKFASLEDVIIHKVIAGRARDLEDVTSMLLRNPDYDIKYINQWLKEFDQSLDKNFSEQFKKMIKEIE